MGIKFLLPASIFLMVCCSIAAQTSITPSGKGTSNDPYLIESLENLFWLSENSSVWSEGVYFKQTKDIDASETKDWNEGKGFSPIGNSAVSFKGCYNAVGHIIDGLNINMPSVDYVGLFGLTSGAEIDSLGLTNCSIIGKTYVGGIAGRIQNLSIVSQCFSTGSVSGTSCVGGLIGKNYSSSFIYCCYSTASVSADYSVGGLVGLNFSSSVLFQSYSTGVVSGNTSVGGLVGKNSDFSNVASCYFNYDESLQSTGVGVDDFDQIVYGLFTKEMQTFASFPDFDFAGWEEDGTEDVWTIVTGLNDGFPVLIWQIDDFSKPVLGETVALLSDDKISASLSGSFTSLGISNPVDYGFCYSTTVEIPEINTCDTISLGAVNGYEVGGPFMEGLTAINSDFKYYIRAYARNVADTVYSPNVALLNGNSTSVLYLEIGSLKVYPNPAQSVVYVSGSTGIASVYKISGEKILTCDLSQGNSIDISHIEKGIYIIEVDGECIKLIKR